MPDLPKENYHILGYITFAVLAVMTFADLLFYVRFAYGYYQILRWLVFCFSIWTAYRNYNENNKSIWILIFAAVAIIFNPIFMLKFAKDVWFVIDCGTLALFVVYALLKFKKAG